ncbi:hypothetical protein LQW54_006156 [Pestalotiopsis sp. IQ-011]
MSQSQAQQEADARQAHRRWKAKFKGPDWAKQSLSDEGKDFVDDVMHEVSWYMQPPRSAERAGKHPHQDALVKMVTNWRQDERTSQDGGPAIFSAIFRYILADTVRKCPRWDQNSKFPRLLELMRFLVRDLDNGDVLSQDQMREDILALTQNDQLGPLHPREGSDRRRREYFSLHAFCLDMYRDGTMRNVAMAEFALDTFSNQRKEDLTSAIFANQWLLNAAEDIYRSVENAKDDWLYWTFELVWSNVQIGPGEVCSLPSVNEYHLVNESAPARMAELEALPVGSDLKNIRMLRENAMRQLAHATSDKRRRELRNQIATLNVQEDEETFIEADAMERQKED